MQIIYVYNFYSSLRQNYKDTQKQSSWREISSLEETQYNDPPQGGCNGRLFPPTSSVAIQKK